MILLDINLWLLSIYLNAPNLSSNSVNYFIILLSITRVFILNWSSKISRNWLKLSFFPYFENCCITSTSLSKERDFKYLKVFTFKLLLYPPINDRNHHIIFWIKVRAFLRNQTKSTENKGLVYFFLLSIYYLCL